MNCARSCLNVDSCNGLVENDVGSKRPDIGNVFLELSQYGNCCRRNSSIEVEMWGAFVTRGAHRLGIVRRVAKRTSRQSKTAYTSFSLGQKPNEFNRMFKS